MVAPRILILRLACSITASTRSRAPDRVAVSKTSQASRAPARERRKPGPRGGTAPGRRAGPGAVQGRPDGGGGDLHPGHQQLAAYPAIPPPGILPDQTEHQDANRAYGARPARVPGPGPPGVPACSYVAVPAEHGVRAHHQVQSLEHVPREPVQQRRQQRPVTRGEPHPARTELPPQDREADGAAGESQGLCPGCLSAAAAAARTRAPHRGRPAAAARSITMPLRSPVVRAPHRPPSRRTSASPMHRLHQHG